MADVSTEANRWLRVYIMSGDGYIKEACFDFIIVVSMSLFATVGNVLYKRDKDGETDLVASVHVGHVNLTSILAPSISLASGSLCEKEHR